MTDDPQKNAKHPGLGGRRENRELLKRIRKRSIKKLGKIVKKFPSGVEFIAISIILVIGGWIVATKLGLKDERSLALLAVLSGIIYAFTNANDSRIVSRRFIFNSESLPHPDLTSNFLYPDEFVAWGGVIGALLTWFMFPFIYRFFSPELNRPFSHILRDLVASFSLTFLGIPVFLIVGLLALLSTIVYLGFIEKQSLTILSVPMVIIASSTVFIGARVFGDTIPASLLPTSALFIVSLISYIVYGKISDERSKVQNELEKNFSQVFPKKERFRGGPLSGTSPWILATIHIVCEIGINVIVRASLAEIYRRDIGEGFAVSLGLRSWYFTVFLFFGLFYIFIWNPKTKERLFLSKKIEKEKRFGRWVCVNWTRVGVILVTTFTFVLAFFLKTPLYAKNLFASPLIFAVTQALTFPIIGALYYTDAWRQNRLRRLSQVFGRINDLQEPMKWDLRTLLRYPFTVCYGAILILCIIWICLIGLR